MEVMLLQDVLGWNPMLVGSLPAFKFYFVIVLHNAFVTIDYMPKISFMGYLEVF